MPMSPSSGNDQSYLALRERLDEMGYFQSFLPECLPLVEALFNDLLTTTHNLKLCKEKSKIHSDQRHFGEESNINCEEESYPSAFISSLPQRNYLEEESKEEELKKKIRDLEALNEQAMSMVSKAQQESLEKSKKIMKLEPHKARIVERNGTVIKPKMEISTFVKDFNTKFSNSVSGPPASMRTEPPLDVVEMYERKNNQLTDVAIQSEKRINDLKERIFELEKVLTEVRKGGPPNLNPKSSSYVAKILKDNAELREKLKRLDSSFCKNPKFSPTRDTCFHRGHIHHQTDQSGNKNEGLASRTHKHIEHQHVHIHELQDELKAAHEEIRELKRRLSHVSVTNKNLKDKVGILEHQRGILIDTKDATKIRELISFMEKQRNVYRDNMHELLKKLDNNGTFIWDNEKSDNLIHSTRPYLSSAKEIKVIDEACPDCQDRTKKGVSSDLIDNLNREISDLEVNKRELCHRLEEEKKKSSTLEKDLISAEAKIDKWKQRVLAPLSGNEEVQRERHFAHGELQSAREKIQELSRELRIKEEDLNKLSDEKDEILTLLDSKTLSLERLKEERTALINDMNRLDTDKSSADKRVGYAMSQLNQLQSECRSIQCLKDDLLEKYEREKSAGVKLRKDNLSLKADLEIETHSKDEAQNQSSEIKSYVQKYVNEVKRIEELLAICEKERSELLRQYKNLSSDVSTAETYGRKLEAQVSDLQIELKSKEVELNAVNLRLETLEKDIAEISLSNENYKTQLASYSIRADLAEAELKESRNQQSWINSDLSNVHELAVTLNSQKVELLSKISEQEAEINAMTNELQSLRDDVMFLKKECVEEKKKTRLLEDKISSSGRNTSFE